MTNPERARRKELVTLSVIASSAVTFAATWLGVAAVDGGSASTVADAAPSGQPGVAQAAQLVQPSSGTTLPAPASTLAATPSAGTLQPVPQPTRQTVIIRRSRAS